MNRINLEGATLDFVDDHTHAKGFVGSSKELKVKGISTEEGYEPNAYVQVCAWLRSQGVTIPGDDPNEETKLDPEETETP